MCVKRRQDRKERALLMGPQKWEAVTILTGLSIGNVYRHLQGFIKYPIGWETA